ncbi:decapping endonuclease targeting mRNA [Ascosphaera acerosa]|nr:decapping endonuclease targeting mRNA [Ascosphaera acerosa]
MDRQSFEIQPIGRFVGTSAAIKRPREIAYFSFDDEHNFRLDESGLRYYYPPALPADLNRGFDTFKKRDDSVDTHLDSLLETIIALEKETGEACNVDIVTWRGMMTKIMTAPFDPYSCFEMNATRFQDTIFIEENHAFKMYQAEKAQQIRMRPGMPPFSMMTYWGYKFETLALIPRPWDEMSREEIEGRPDEVVNNHAQYCSVVRTGIGKSSIILGGEVDAVWDCKPETKGEPINWVELKTTAEVHNARQASKYQLKLLNFWAQSFLLGVPKIVVGVRDERGILRRIEEIATHDIPALVKQTGSNAWDGNICINFTAAFLAWLKETITSDGVWRIRMRERSSVIEVFRMEETGHGDILSDSFKEWRDLRQTGRPGAA